MSTFSRRWNFFAAGLLFAALSRADTMYRLQDLGTLGGANSRAYGMNEAGWVVGEAETKDGGLHAFLWTPTNGMVDLGTLGGEISRAYAVNERGQVVGEAELQDGRMQPFVWSAAEGITNLALPAGFREGYAYANNNFGMVVGVGDVGEETRALMWSVDGPQVPPELADRSSLAHDVSDLGDVAGQSEVGGGEAFLSRAFFAGHAGFFENLGGLTGEYSSAALAVNEEGLAAGYAEQGDATHAVLFNPTNGWTDLDSLDNVYSVAHGLNDRGVAVGLFVRSHEDDDRAFVANDEGMADLNELVEPDEPWLLVEARDVNNAGQIAGYGLVKERERAFLLTPLPAAEGGGRPRIRIVQPAPHTKVAEGGDLVLVATADADAKLRRVTFFANGTILGSALKPPYEFAWNNVAAGSYHLVAEAVDVQGRSRRSGRVPVVVTLDDPHRPRVAMLEPDDGTALATGSNIVLLAEAGDPDGAIRSVALRVDGQSVAESTGSTVQLLWTPPSTGLYVVVAVAVDEEGLAATSSAARIHVTDP